MKERFFIKGDVADKITYYHLIAFAVTLPFDRLYSELALASLLIHTICHLRREELKQFSWIGFIIPSSIYLLTIIATTYTSYTGDAFSEWERQAAIALFPLIVLLNGFDFKQYLLNIILASAFSCALAIVCLYWIAFNHIFASHLPISSIFSNAFLNHNFAAPIDMHATYFSMYIALGAAGCIFALIKSGSRKWKFVYIVLCFILTSGLIQLSSRAVLIAFAVIVNFVFPVFWISKSKRLYYLAVSLLLTVSMFFAFTKIDALKSRFIVELKEDLTKTDAANNLLEPRAVRWAAAKDLMLKSPVYGHGSGSEIPLLKEVYYEHKLYNSYLNSLNIHNQYLSMVIKTGAVGLLVLLFVLFSGFRSAVQSRDGLFFSFLLIIAIVCFSENIMDGNKGIFFFAFFFSLFWIKKKEKKITQK